MQRWWFLDTKNKAHDTPTSISSQPSATSSEPDETAERPWTFAVHVPLTLNAFEAVAVTGECATLGQWQPQQAVLLERQNDGE